MKLSYNKNALKSFIENRTILVTRVSHLFKYTNNVTVNRWANGKNIYIHNLLAICNEYKLDLLAFLKHNERPFTTTIEEIIAMENHGVRLKDLLKEKGIEYEQCQTIDDTTNCVSKTIADNPNKSNNEIHKTEFSNALLPEDIVDRIIKIQFEAFKHETQSLDRQQNIFEKQIEILNKRIYILEKENNELKKKLY